VGTSIDHPLVQLALGTAQELFKREYQSKGVRYYTDASTFVPGLGNDVPVVIYGPGKETNAHQPNEYVEISKYLDAIKFYKEMALRYFAQ
jgi:succinyl-diaminopimelate desuccinylase